MSMKTVLHRLAVVAAGVVCAAAGPLARAQDALPAQRVSIDPETGELRAAPHDTAPAAALRAAPGARQAPHPLLSRLQAGQIPARMGAIGRRTDLEMLSYSVVRVRPDGSLAQVCVEGEDAAAHALHSHPTEAPNDR